MNWKPLARFSSGPEYDTFAYLAPHASFLYKVKDSVWTLSLSQMILSNLWLLSGAVSSVLSSSYETDAIQRTTTAVTMFNAGFKENVMPSSAEVIHHPLILVHPRAFWNRPLSTTGFIQRRQWKMFWSMIGPVFVLSKWSLIRPGMWLMTAEWRSPKARTASIPLRSLHMATRSWPSKSLQMPPFRWRPHLKMSSDKSSGVSRRPHCSWHPHSQHGYEALSTSCGQDLQATQHEHLFLLLFLLLHWQSPGSLQPLSRRMIQSGSMGSTREFLLRTLCKLSSSTIGWSRMPIPRNWQLSLL